ncbi:hypothetical protein ACQPZG_31855 [Streptomyces sp. CA-294286]|uniref:hypothetical protein n=1 Tax=Streptomyces sp. CA-294286 TaxID=3240070 RepID=UPI003D8EF95B
MARTWKFTCVWPDTPRLPHDPIADPWELNPIPTSPPPPAAKPRTDLDHHIETVTGHPVATLWTQHDHKLLTPLVDRLVDAHRLLASAEVDVAFHRGRLARLLSGENPLDEAAFVLIERTLRHLKQAASLHDRRRAETVARLEEVKQSTPRPERAELPELAPPDFAALLAISQGATLRQNLLTQRTYARTGFGTIGQLVVEFLEGEGLVERDTSHPLQAGQPLTVTPTGREILSGTRRPAPPAARPPVPGFTRPPASRATR